MNEHVHSIGGSSRVTRTRDSSMLSSFPSSLLRSCQAASTTALPLYSPASILLKHSKKETVKMESSECHKIPKETPQEQQQRVWSAVCTHNTAFCPHSSKRTWPTYDVVLSDVANSDYNATLQCPHDVRRTTADTPNSSSKALRPFGVAVSCQMQLFAAPHGVTPYTGLLSPDSTLEHCIVRLSSAIKPPASEIKSRLALSDGSYQSVSWQWYSKWQWYSLVDVKWYAAKVDSVYYHCQY